MSSTVPVRSIRVDDELWARVEERAKADVRSVNAWVLMVLRQATAAPDQAAGMSAALVVPRVATAAEYAEAAKSANEATAAHITRATQTASPERRQLESAAETAPAVRGVELDPPGVGQEGPAGGTHTPLSGFPRLTRLTPGMGLSKADQAGRKPGKKS